MFETAAISLFLALIVVFSVGMFSGPPRKKSGSDLRAKVDLAMSQASSKSLKQSTFSAAAEQASLGTVSDKYVSPPNRQTASISKIAAES